MLQPHSSRVWVVLPAYNEASYIGRVLKKVLQQTHQVIVVDDGSRDGTDKIISQFPVHFLRHRLNLGKGAALKTGCDYAFEVMKADAIVMLDADDQHDPREIQLFLKALKAGHQVVFGARQEPKNMPWIRLKMNRLSSFATYLLFGQYILDIPSGYKAFSRQAYQQLRWEASDYSVEMEITARTITSKLPFTTVCITTIYHDLNKGFTALDALAALKSLIRLRLTL